MAVDSVIELDCLPKRVLGAEGILERLKERQRAAEVIAWFRAAGDSRSPDQMGFEFSRSVPGQDSGKQLIVVQDLLDHAAALDEQAGHCLGCPANIAGTAYGCVSFIDYPISANAEVWLLERLPVPDEPLVWLLLRQGIQKLGYDGASVKALREAQPDDEPGQRRYFELPIAPQRRLGEVRVSSDQALEMILGVGPRIIPNHAGILLLFFAAIDRDLDAPTIQNISSVDRSIRETIDFAMPVRDEDDACTRQFIAFFHALYTAWKLDKPLYVDA